MEKEYKTTELTDEDLAQVVGGYTKNVSPYEGSPAPGPGEANCGSEKYCTYNSEFYLNCVLRQGYASTNGNDPTHCPKP